MTAFSISLLAFGFFILVLTVVAVFLISLREAADPDQAAPGDLNELERELVDRHPESGETSAD